MNLKNNKKSLIALALLFCMIAPMLSLTTVRAAYVTPSGTMSLTQNGGSSHSWSIDTFVGDTVTIDLRIDSVPYNSTTNGGHAYYQSPIWGWVANINWTSSNLQLTGVTEGSYLKQYSPTGTQYATTKTDGATFFIGDSAGLWDNVNGYIQGGLMQSCKNIPQPVNSTTSSKIAGGVLATLSFTVIGDGVGTVTVSNGKLKQDASTTDFPATTGSGAEVTMSIPTVPLTVVSAHGNPTPAVGTNNIFAGQTVTASVVSPVVEGATINGIHAIYTCTGWTGTGSVCTYDPDTGDAIYSGTDTSVTFTMPLADDGSSITWNWVQSTSPISPQAVITTASDGYTNRPVVLSGVNSIYGIETVPTATYCNITTWAWHITWVNGSATDYPNSKVLTLNAASVGSTTGNITATLTVTAPDSASPANPDYTPTASTTLSIPVLSSAVTGTIRAVQSGTTGPETWQLGPVGSMVSVDIRVDGASNVWGWATNVNWDPSKLQLQSVTEGSYLNSAGATWFIGSNPGLIDNIVGTVSGGIACSYQTSPQTSPSSSGVLATLTFKVLAAQTNTNITLTNAKLLAGSGDQGTALPTGNSTLFVAPEYALGALIALVAAFAAFIAFAAAKKVVHLPSFNRDI